MLTEGTLNLGFAYDGENRIKSTAGMAAVSYTYDGAGTGGAPFPHSDKGGCRTLRGFRRVHPHSRELR